METQDVLVGEKVMTDIQIDIVVVDPMSPIIRMNVAMAETAVVEEVDVVMIVIIVTTVALPPLIENIVAVVAVIEIDLVLPLQTVTEINMTGGAIDPDLVLDPDLPTIKEIETPTDHLPADLENQPTVL